MLAGALLIPAVPLVFAARAYSASSLVFAATSVAAAAACGRLAFDSILQRDGAEAARIAAGASAPRSRTGPRQTAGTRRRSARGTTSNRAGVVPGCSPSSSIGSGSSLSIVTT